MCLRFGVFRCYLILFLVLRLGLIQLSALQPLGLLGLFCSGCLSFWGFVCLNSVRFRVSGYLMS